MPKRKKKTIEQQSLQFNEIAGIEQIAENVETMYEFIESIERSEKSEEKKLSEILRTNFMPYAISVIESRAIPDLRDGLKPSHRKVLVTMNDMHLNPAHFRSKCANIAGQVLKLNPHSDASAYATLVRLTAAHEALLAPLIDGKGNFGKHYSSNMAYSAARYTEARLLPISLEFFRSIRKNTVEFVDNYDSTMKEPTVLPVTFPNILANPNQGIAVGMASNICSFNFRELCLATAERIRHPRSDLLDIMPGPDFTTGALLLNDREAIHDIYKTGLGSFVLRSKYTYNKKDRIIEITEIPYSTTIEQIMASIIDLVKKGKIKEINDIRDEGDLSGMTLAIDVKRGTDPDALMEKLFALTPLQTTFAANFNVLVNNRAEVLGVYSILDNWIDWRRECIRREYAFDLEANRHTLHIYEGLEKILLDIDKVIRIIRKTEEDSQVIPALMKTFKLDKEQAEYVAEIKLRNLNKDYIMSRINKIAELKDIVADLEKITSSKEELNKIMIRQLKELAKTYGIPRKTEMADFAVQTTADVKKAEENFHVTVATTKNGYVKKIRTDAVKDSSEISCGDGDEIVETFTTMNTGELLVFTDKQNAYKVQLADIPLSKPAEAGEYIVNLIEKEADENILYSCVLDADKYMLFAFKNGKAARVPMSAYETKQNRKKLLKAYGDVAPVMRIYSVTEEDDFCYVSKKGRKVRFKAGLLPAKTTKNTQGVQVINILKTDPEIESFGTVKEMAASRVKPAAKIPATGRV